MEISANELRIGSTYNSVKFNLPVKLEAGDFYNLIIRAEGADISHYIDEYIQPILLTEEWLVKFGFEEIGVIHKKGWLNIWHSSYAEKYQIRIYKVGDDVEKSINIEYVHQLQNLYFALTGKELSIK
jgi:hypothetical protein